ncbi:hypothetical protein TUBRATIS_001850 [Tubulinosema ratisbonensis]|uniref:MULE transposase domain-containing protein n=1 Tax=Tubulinosema ratisbonensis TaxID=291195 RepID=A0A437AQ05_9MICR|nr:hypothetical protein TUBRATIS_001850 [Tubulinosema ratisbonensis]
MFELIYTEYKKENTQILDDFLFYFKKTYIGSSRNSGIFEKIYDPKFWSVYSRILKNLPRTTNSVEAWHRNLNQKSLIAHPNIAKFIDIIKKENEKTRFNITQIFNGSFSFNLFNPSKEVKLQIILNNFNHFKELNYFKALITVYNWKFDEEMRK